MEFNVDKKPKENIEKYGREEIDIAYKFAKAAYKEFGTFTKAIVLFGSLTKKDKIAQAKGDIDILMLVDDLSLSITPEVAETYRIIVQKLVRDISQRLHITTLKLTSFWEYVRMGDPVAINILRDGTSMLDTGFFDPLQVLLKQGRIRPSPESIWNYFVRAPATIVNSKWHILQATLDLYWAVIDSAHAALMRHGEIPPSPEHVADLMQDVLVKKGVLEPKYPQVMRNFYELSKKITHREMKEVTGDQYSRYLADAQDFVNEMKKIVEIKSNRPGQQNDAK
ncbi:hypothetical protein GF345_00485 [Candidatus Woesearchaeota archaeon]|nr:hypothetical protein [Candidatus Woesearchaeota archaeon]